MSKKAMLIDVDSSIPNLALMKISAYLKQSGYEVGFNVPDPDIIYASCIFPRNKYKTDGLTSFYPNIPIDIGGSGVDLHKSLPPEIDLICPDYSLYPDCDMDIGFTTRGCIRNCPFCIVPSKEGKFRRVQHPREFHDPSHKKMMLLDNNILADKEWFMEITDWMIQNKLRISFNQGIDARLIDQEIAERIKQIKTFEEWRVAMDDLSVKDKVVKGIRLLQDAGLDTRHKLICYVYINDNSEFESALNRCNTLRELNVTPYVMLNQNVKFDGIVKLLRRWTQPMVFYKFTFQEYLDLRTAENKVY